jgi:hypothetical protein
MLLNAKFKKSYLFCALSFLIVNLSSHMQKNMVFVLYIYNLVYFIVYLFLCFKNILILYCLLFN